MTFSDSAQEASTAGNGLAIRFNFNDFFGGLMVLCALLVSNDWSGISDLFCYVTKANWWPRIFFVTFYFLVALIILNIIISFVIEVYDALGNEVEF